MSMIRFLAVLWFVAAAAVAGAQTNTVITSDEMEFDYKRSIATFDRNVKVTDPQRTITADKIVMTFDGTNSVKSVTATGNVKIWQAEKVATCRKAVYTAATGEIDLTGNVWVTRGQDTLATEEVIFWVNEDRMRCPKPVKMVISQQSQDGGAPKLKLGP
jgi:lipopolysaccharide export system protein LptA